MMATLIRSASIVPSFQYININRYSTLGLLYKISNSMPTDRISQYHVRDMRSKMSELQDTNKAVFSHHLILSVRTFSDKTPSSIPPPPNPPNLPDREQVERAFFRVVAFLWDYGLWLFAWSHRMIKVHIVEKPLVKLYWKRFHEKMEEAKKDS